MTARFSTPQRAYQRRVARASPERDIVTNIGFRARV
jgi:hypothetical protein